MPKKNEPPLLSVLKDVAALPAVTHKDAVRNLVAEWRQKHPLVEEVASGKTTFEETVADLVSQNMRIRFLNRRGDPCDNPDFEGSAKKVADQLSGVMSLTRWRMAGRVCTVDDLTQKLDFWDHVRFCFRMDFGAAATFVLALTVLGYFVGRNETPHDIRQLWMVWSIAVMASMGFSVFLIVGQVFVGLPSLISARKELAAKTLEDAQFLDRMFKLAAA